MRAHVIKVTPLIPAAKAYVMADIGGHPEAPWIGEPGSSVDDAEALIVACHPDDERRLRDVIAVAQEHEDVGATVRRAFP